MAPEPRGEFPLEFSRNLPDIYPYKETYHPFATLIITSTRRSSRYISSCLILAGVFEAQHMILCHGRHNTVVTGLQFTW